MAITASKQILNEYIHDLLHELPSIDWNNDILEISDESVQDSVLPSPHPLFTSNFSSPVSIQSPLIPCFNPFMFMSLQSSPEQNAQQNRYMASLMLLNMLPSIPTSTLKRYCLQQCQTLLGQNKRVA